MNSKVLRVYDPPMCCSSGACGPELDPKLARFAADLDWLQRMGVAVRRYNPAQEPDAFVSNPDVRRALQERGRFCLPMVLWGEETLASGAYPDRVTLEQAVGRSRAAEAEAAGGA